MQPIHFQSNLSSLPSSFLFDLLPAFIWKLSMLGLTKRFPVLPAGLIPHLPPLHGLPGCKDSFFFLFFFLPGNRPLLPFFPCSVNLAEATLSDSWGEVHYKCCQITDSFLYPPLLKNMRNVINSWVSLACGYMPSEQPLQKQKGMPFF